MATFISHANPTVPRQKSCAASAASVELQLPMLVEGEHQVATLIGWLTTRTGRGRVEYPVSRAPQPRRPLPDPTGTRDRVTIERLLEALRKFPSDGSSGPSSALR